MPNWSGRERVPKFSARAGVDPAQRAWVRSYAGNAPEGEIEVPAESGSRQSSDSTAAWARWHSVRVELAVPEEKKVWFLALERARVDTLAGRDLRGVRSNLSIDLSSEGRLTGPSDLYRLARSVFSGEAATPDHAGLGSGTSHSRYGLLGAVRHRIKLGRVFPRVSWLQSELFRLSVFVEDQQRFQDASTQIIESLPNWFPARDTRQSRPAVRDAIPGKPVKTNREKAAADGQSENPLGGTQYAVFSLELDETGSARQWLTAEDRALLAMLDSPDRQRTQHLARALQRRLLAVSRPSWDFDCDEGVLDARRLCRLVTSPNDGRVFRRQRDREESQACVCFLVDLSGSMSQQRRVMAALTLDFVLQTLDQCSIRSEALAFTTRFFSPNPLVEEWRRRGEPAMPGRLNAVRHVVLKGRNERWKASRSSLALLLKKGFGRENLDGEALDWAARRLSMGSERQKHLVVFSDGEPFDEATVEANGSLYLEDHLRHVIQAVDRSGIVLSAIGFGSGVARFFSNSITVSRIEDLPREVFDRVGDLLAPRSRSAARP